MKSSKLHVYLTLTTHLNLDLPHLKCSVAKCVRKPGTGEHRSNISTCMKKVSSFLGYHN